MFGKLKKLSRGILIFLIFLYACMEGKKETYVNNQGQQVSEIYYRNGALKSRIVYKDDSKRNYLYTTYFSDGLFHDSALYLRDTITGLRKVYDRKNSLMHYETYYKGILNGIHKALYDNGVSSFEGYRKDGYKVGEWLFHYNDGRLITYEFYDSIGNIRYFRKYDEDNNLIRKNGNGIVNIFVQNDTIVDTTFVKGNIYLATPPDCRLTLSIGDGKSNEMTNIERIDVKTQLVPFLYKLSSSGSSNLGLLYEIVDNKTGKSEQYFYNLPVYIRRTK